MRMNARATAHHRFSVTRPRPLRRALLGLVAGVLCVVTTGAFEAEAQALRYLENPGFELPGFASGWVSFPDTDVPGWTSPDGVVEIWRSGLNGVASRSGNHHAEANANSPSGMWTDVCLAAGESVDWGFWHRGRVTNETIRFTIAGVEQGQYTTGTAGWQQYSGTFVPTTTGAYRFHWEPLTAGSLGNFVDDLSVSLIPHVEFADASHSSDEFQGSAGLVVLVNGIVTSTQSVEVTVTGGSADPGDYTLTSMLTIPPGTYDGTTNTALTVDLTIVQDSYNEGNETLDLALTNPTTGIRTGPADAYACVSPTTSTVVTIVDDEAPDLEVTMTGPASASVGDELEFVITTTNVGSGPASSIVVSDTLPAGYTFVSGSRSPVANGSVVEWSAWPSLAVGGSLVDTIRISATASGSFTNVGAARQELLSDPTPANNRSPVVTEVCLGPTVTVSTTSELRAAVADSCVRTIYMRSGTYDLTASGSGQMVIDRDLTIENSSLGEVTIDARGASRHFDILSGTVDMTGLTLVDGFASNGGSIQNQGSLTLSEMTFSENRAAADGGALYVRAPLLAYNVTFSGNRAGGDGGAMRVRAASTLVHVTMTANQAGLSEEESQGGAIRITNGGSVALQNSIVWGNTQGEESRQLQGTISSNGANIVQGGCSGCTGSDLDSNPLLQSLAMNGGRTRTHALGAGSPAIDAASASSVNQDQRGVARPQGAAPDIGAYEAQVGVQIDDAASATHLPSNSTPYEAQFVVTGFGLVDDYRLTAQFDAAVFAVDSIRGSGITAGSAPNEATAAGLGGGAQVTARVFYRILDVSAGTASDLTLEARGGNGTGSVFDTGIRPIEVVRPDLEFEKSAEFNGSPRPGLEVTYVIRVTNRGTEDAHAVEVLDSLPPEVAFKPGSELDSFAAGITLTAEYSNDGGTSWAYAPISEGCGAASGYDGCVTHLRWTLSGALGFSSPDNTGEVRFTAIIR